MGFQERTKGRKVGPSPDRALPPAKQPMAGRRSAGHSISHSRMGMEHWFESFFCHERLRDLIGRRSLRDKVKTEKKREPSCARTGETANLRTCGRSRGAWNNALRAIDGKVDGAPNVSEAIRVAAPGGAPCLLDALKKG